MGIQPSFWRSNGKTDSAFLSVVNQAFHTNLPTALSAQTWLTSMGYYTNWILINTLINIKASNYTTVGIDINGQVWDWGYNYHGQLGVNTDTINSRCTPVSIFGAKKTFCQIASGNAHTIGIDKNGQVWGWGYNGSGMLGDNSLINKCTPVSIQGTKKTFCKIAIGNSWHTVGIDKNGQVWCWGYNNKGQLGINSIINQCVPVSILGTKKTFCQIGSGENNTVGIDITGQVWGWGYNNRGQLGDNTVISRCTPVSIQGAKKTFCSIYSNQQHNNGDWDWSATWNEDRLKDDNYEYEGEIELEPHEKDAKKFNL